jgi:hypothetical protein
LIATGLAVAGGILLGRLVGSSLFEKKKPKTPEDPKVAADAKSNESHTPDDDGASAPSAKSGATVKSAPKRSAKAAPELEGFCCRLGDVVLRTTGEEAWLAGAIVLSETDAPPLFALFHSPDAGGDRALLVEPGESGNVLWLRPIAGLGVRGEPPSALEHEGDHFERARRLPLHAERIGTGTPDVAKSVIFAEYTGAGDARLVVLSGDGACHAYLGQSLLAGSFDVLPSGKSTLED